MLSIFGSSETSDHEYISGRAPEDIIDIFAIWLLGHARGCLVFWPLFAAVMVPFAFALLHAVTFDSTSLTNFPPASTRSAVTAAVMQQHYGDLLGRKYEMVRISCLAHCDSAGNVVSRSIVEQLTSALKLFEYRHKGVVLRMHSYFTYDQLSDIENPMMARDRQSILFQWEWDVTEDVKSDAHEFVGEVNKLIDEINAYQLTSDIGALHVQATGPSFLSAALRAKVPLSVFCIVAPTTIGVLALRLESTTKVIVPVVGFVLSLSIGFGMTYMSIPRTPQAAMMPIVMVLVCEMASLMFSLIILNYCEEERLAGTKLHLALRIAIRASSKHLAYLTLALMSCSWPIAMLSDYFRSLAIGTCIMLAVALASQITFLPAALASYPWLGGFELAPDTAQPAQSSGERYEAVLLQEPSAEDADEARTNPAEGRREHDVDGLRRLTRPAGVEASAHWLTFTQRSQTQRRRLNMVELGIMYLLLSLLTFKSLTMRPGHAFELDIPRHTTEWASVMDLHQKFSATVACFMPISIIATALAPDIASARSLDSSIVEALQKTYRDSTGVPRQTWDPDDPRLTAFKGSIVDALDNDWPADSSVPGAPPRTDFTSVRELLKTGVELRPQTQLLPKGVMDVETLFPALFGLHSDFLRGYHEEVKMEKGVQRTLSGPFNAAGAPFAAAGTLRCVLPLPVLGDQPWHEAVRYVFCNERGTNTLAVQTAGSLRLGFHGQISSESLQLFTQADGGPIMFRVVVAKPDGPLSDEEISGMSRDVPHFITAARKFLEGDHMPAQQVDWVNWTKQLLRHSRSASPKGVFTLNVRSQAFFDANCRMANALIEATRGHPHALSPSNLESASFIGERFRKDVKCLDYRIDRVESGIFNHLTDHRNVKMPWDRSVSTNNDAMMTLVFPSVDPFGSESFALVRDVRAALEHQTEYEEEAGSVPGLAYMALSASTVAMDIIEETRANSTIACWCYIFVCSIAFALWLGIASIPLMFLLTVIAPITWTYGLAVCVYQDGYLAWTGIPGLTPIGDPPVGLCWQAPALTLTLMFGSGMANSVNILVHALEFQHLGVDNEESVQFALGKCGWLSTTRHLVLGTSFLGLLLTHVPMVNQIGFLLVCGSICELWVVNPILMPFVLSRVLQNGQI